MKTLTKKQQKVYDVIERCISENGYAPSVREICQELNLASPSTVHFHIKHLAEKGYLEKRAGKVRALSLTDRRQEQDTDRSAPPRVPILGNVAAGSPILAQECIEDYLIFDTGGEEEEYFALRVRGESMINAGILSGDLVVVHRQPTARSGEIVVALLGEEATVKTLSRKDGMIWLLPSNPEFHPIDGRDCELMGRVVAVVRQY